MARGGRLKEEIVTEASSNSIDESEPEHQGVDARIVVPVSGFRTGPGLPNWTKCSIKRAFFFSKLGSGRTC